MTLQIPKTAQRAMAQVSFTWRMPGLSRLPPDEWFEDEEGEAEMLRVEEERLARLRTRSSRG